MDASDSMTRNVVVVPPELSLHLAWQIMQRRRVRHLPVVQGGALIGIISDRDILLRARLDEAGRVEVPNDPVALAMNPKVETCTVDVAIGDLAGRMIERKIDAIPVVGKENHLIGLVTSTDLLRLLIRQTPPTRRLPFDYRVYQGEVVEGVE